MNVLQSSSWATALVGAQVAFPRHWQDSESARPARGGTNVQLEKFKVQVDSELQLEVELQLEIDTRRHPGRDDSDSESELMLPLAVLASG